MDQSATLTLREAAFAFGESLKDIVRLVEEHSEFTSKSFVGKRSLRILAMSDLMYLQAINEFGDLLTPKGRHELHSALRNSHSVEQVMVGRLSLQMERLQADVAKRIKALDQVKSMVDGDPEDPTIKGTSVEVYRVSALLNGGATVQQVLEDYPSLKKAQVELAMDYATAIPKKGRPYPKKSFKRSLAALNLEALDEVLSEDGIKG